MNLVVDGIIYQLQARGGISRLYSEVLPRMCEMEPSLRVTMLTWGRTLQPLPAHPSIGHRSFPPLDQVLRPRRLWGPVNLRLGSLMRRLCAGSGEGEIWHSTYYTLPLGWRGAKVVTVHDMIHERFAHIFAGPANDHFRWWKRRCILGADAVICVSGTTQRDIQLFYGLDPSRIRIVPNAYSQTFKPLGRVDRREGMPARPFLLYVGDRRTYKNFWGLVEAYSAWPQGQEVDLVVVGNGWSTQERRALARLRIEDRVHLHQGVDDQGLCELYNRAAAFVFPSLYEGFGIPLLEAMACGCPVVASRIPSTLEVAGDCPIYFDPQAMETLLEALDLALAEGRGSERVQRGLELMKRYSWDRTAREVLEVYRSLGEQGA